MYSFEIKSGGYVPKVFVSGTDVEVLYLGTLVSSVMGVAAVLAEESEEAEGEFWYVKVDVDWRDGEWQIIEAFAALKNKIEEENHG